jgi:hypothetical protein
MKRFGAVMLVVGLLALLASCGADEGGGNGRDGEGPSSSSDELVVEPASYELIAGEPGRFIAGLLTLDQLFVSYGTVEMRFFYLGTKEGTSTAEPGPRATADFLKIEGDPGASTDRPSAGPPSHGRGVYATEVTFDKPGFWAVDVTAQVEGKGELVGNGAFEVLEDNVVPAPGEEAPRTENLVLSYKDAPRQAIDSRAQGGQPVPDEILHQTTIAESIRRGEPALVVFSTPVYCISRFCGPVTDMVEKLARDYAGRANFIHVEIWRNFEGKVINKGAADWIYKGGDLLEPWLFLIGADGRIVARWDNVATRAEIEPFLGDLPK